MIRSYEFYFSMGEISGGSGSETMTVVQTAAINKETGNQTLSRNLIIIFFKNFNVIIQIC